MYGQFYGLTDEPFRLSPDARFCFQHRSFSRAKSYFHYALGHREGFVLVTGQPGTGKTTLIDTLLGELDRSRILSVRIESAQVQGDDLVRRVAYAFGLSGEGLDKATLLHNLERYLADRVKDGGTALLVVDEAQTLPPSALEELRLITNIRPFGHPVIQIFLVGQEALRERILSPELEQLHQRILCACHLDPLSLVETRDYIEHRLQCAGWTGDPVIEAGAVRVIHGASGGIPRLINKFADRLLLHGSLEGLHKLGADDAHTVMEELSDELLLNVAAETEAERTGPADDEQITPIDFARGPTAKPRAKSTSGGTSPPARASQDESLSLTPGSSGSPGATPAERNYAASQSAGGGRRPAPPEASVTSFNLAPRDAPPENAGKRPTERSEPRAAPAARVRAVPERNQRRPAATRVSDMRRSPWLLPLMALLLLGVGFSALQWFRSGSTEQTPAVSGTATTGSAGSTAGSNATPATAAPAGSNGQTTALASSDAPVPGAAPEEAPVVIADESPQTTPSIAGLAESRRRAALAEAVGEPIAEPAAAPVTQPVAEPLAETVAEPVTQPVTAPVTEPLAETVAQRTEPVAEPVTQAAVEPIAVPEAPPVAQPTVEPIIEPVIEPVAEPVTEPVAEPAAELSVQPIPIPPDNRPPEAPAPAPAPAPDRAGPTDLVALSSQLDQLGLASSMSDGRIRLNLQENVPFEFDSASLPSEAQPVLERLATLLGNYGDTRVRVIGHTDSLGSSSYNQRLSLRRAQAVSRYLAEQGVDPQRLSVVGMGEQQPLADRGDRQLSRQEARLMDRRIEVLIEPN